MIPDTCPAVVNAIRGGIYRRGALVALLAAVPFTAHNLERANAVAAQERGTRTKAASKKKKRSRPGPAGPAGAQGPAGPQGAPGLPGTPRTITIVTREGPEFSVAADGFGTADAACEPDEIATGGGLLARGASPECHIVSVGILLDGRTVDTIAACGPAAGSSNTFVPWVRCLRIT